MLINVTLSIDNIKGFNPIFGMKKIDNSSPPFFSVVITTFNRSNIVGDAIISLLEQTFADWEAIIIDDGSTDNTREVINSHLLSSDRLSYFYQENVGAATAKNSGIVKAKGRFITFLDSDDEYRFDHLQTRYDILKNETDISFLHGGIEIVGNPFVPDRFDPTRKVHLSECVIGGTFFVRNEVAHQLNGFRNIPMGSDADFYDRIKRMGITVKKVNIPSYIYHRNHADSVTNKW